MNRSFSAVCPYCRLPTNVTPAPLSRLESISAGYGASRGVTEVTDEKEERWYTYGSKRWWIGRCNACHKALLVQGPGHDVFPTPRPEPVDPRVPLPMRADVEEARQCFIVGAYNATVVMARRALQCAAVGHGAPVGRELEKQIEDLAARGVITTSEKTMADVTRWVGNVGAHGNAERPTQEESAGEVLVTNVTREEAHDVLELVEQLFRSLYVVPATVAERKRGLGK